MISKVKYKMQTKTWLGHTWLDLAWKETQTHQQQVTPINIRKRRQHEGFLCQTMWVTWHKPTNGKQATRQPITTWHTDKSSTWHDHMRGKERMKGTWNNAKYQNKRLENLNKKQNPNPTLHIIPPPPPSSKGSSRCPNVTPDPNKTQKVQEGGGAEVKQGKGQRARPVKRKMT